MASQMPPPQQPPSQNQEFYQSPSPPLSSQQLPHHQQQQQQHQHQQQQQQQQQQQFNQQQQPGDNISNPSVINNPPSYVPNHQPLMSNDPMNASQYSSPSQEYPYLNTGYPTDLPTFPDGPHQATAAGAGDGGDGSNFAFKSPEPFYSSITKTINQRYQFILDTSTPHWAARWSFSIILLLIFMARIIFAQGWYIICYGLSIYYLNLFIGFLSPKIDPAFRDSDDLDFDDLGDSDNGPMLPTKANEEFRPFIRRLPEFKFWLSATKATLISLFLTLFEIFDLPVFWPILLLYFILLFVTTMRQQIRHMVKYGYVPWDKGKKRYGARKEESLDSFSTTI